MLKEALRRVDQKIQQAKKEKEKEKEEAREIRLQLVKELFKRAEEGKISITLRGGGNEKGIQITPEGELYFLPLNPYDDGGGSSSHSLETALSFAAKEKDTLSVILSAFLKGEARIEVEVK